MKFYIENKLQKAPALGSAIARTILGAVVNAKEMTVALKEKVVDVMGNRNN